MIFKQLFDKNSCTYTYFIADLDSKEALFIDPVNTDVGDYLNLLNDSNLILKYSFETHVHADHISGSGLLRQATGSKTGIGLHCGAETADFQLEGGELFTLGNSTVIKAINTPGHTPGSMSFLWGDKVFTGDALFIGGCGRTDFQNGNSGDLYDSVTQKIFTLPGETLVYPAHDYKGDFVSCVHQERTKNPRLARKTREEFIEIMDNLNLPMPKLIDKAVPANLYCGIEEEEALQMASINDSTASDKDSAHQKLKQVDTMTAKQLMETDNAIVLDVREKDEFDLGHIKNAIHIPRGEIELKVETTLAARRKTDPILIYCASGNRSAIAGHIMSELGYTNISSLKGGYVGWKREM